MKNKKVIVSIAIFGAVCLLILAAVLLFSKPAQAPQLAEQPQEVLIPVTGCSPQENADFEAQVLKLMNQERAKQGVPELKSQPQLAAAALAHSNDMACRGFFSHTNPDGKTPFDRISAQSYDYRAASENIYGGDSNFYSPTEAIKNWLNSPPHKKNMLNPVYTEVGVGAVYLAGTKWGGYMTVVFGTPK
jgi:uncharacterized protein YkwD